MQRERRPIRWWPALLVLAGAALVISVIWSWPNTPRQQRYLRSAGTLFISGAMLLCWWVLFSRARWQLRAGLVGFCAVLIGGLAASFHIRGVNGDLLPILEPRWASARKLPSPRADLRRPVQRQKFTGGEFAQFYGPARDAALPGPDLETNWSAFPPRVVWRRPLGPAWSGFAVKDGLAITMEQRGEKECVLACDALSGAPVWEHEDEARYATTIAGEGPRSTPALSTDAAYTFGATGMLNCLDLHSGKVIWSKNAGNETGAHLPDWGCASSPLLLDDKVLIAVGSSEGTSLAAFAAGDGKLLWKSGHGGADYSSPLVSQIDGTRQIICFNSAGFDGFGTEGRELWHYPWPGGHPHITPPLVVSSNSLVASSGYGTGIELVRIERGSNGFTPKRVWKSMAIKSKFGPLFHAGDFVYGLDDGILACVELKNGQRRWKDGRYGHGQGLLVGSVLLLTSEKGELILIQPSPDQLIELSRFSVFTDKTWNPPALAGEYLFMRNDKEAACLQLTRRNRT